MKISTYINNPITHGFLIAGISFATKEIWIELSSIYSLFIFGLTFISIGLLNHKKTIDFKTKTRRLIKLVTSFFFVALGFSMISYGFSWNAIILTLKLTSVPLITGFLMNIFLIMKKGHWITIITLGFLCIFFLIQSFLSKQEAEMQTTIARQQTVIAEEKAKMAQEQQKISERLKIENDSLKQVITQTK